MDSQQLKHEMTRRQIGVTDLARELKVSPRAVRFWREGRRSIPHDRVMIALERVGAAREAYRDGRQDAADIAQRATMAGLPQSASTRPALPPEVEQQ